VTPDRLHLSTLPEQLRALDPPPDVLALVEAEHAQWRQLHDRLVALIAVLIDVAAADRPLAEVIDAVIEGASIGLDDLVGRRVSAEQVAALLRAHGSTGHVEQADGVTTFRHACGSGRHYWRENPDVVLVAEGEVPGVPAGRPRYCARCIRSITGHGQGDWAVAPPSGPEELCVWTVRHGKVTTDEPGAGADRR
jgi:hypothetical protein